VRAYGPSKRGCPRHDEHGTALTEKRGQRSCLEQQIEPQRDGAESPDRSLTHDLERPLARRRSKPVGDIGKCVEVNRARHESLGADREGRGEEGRERVVEHDRDKRR
jgi:hypothetical protein